MIDPTDPPRAVNPRPPEAWSRWALAVLVAVVAAISLSVGGLIFFVPPPAAPIVAEETEESEGAEAGDAAECQGDATEEPGAPGVAPAPSADRGQGLVPDHRRPVTPEPEPDAC